VRQNDARYEFEGKRSIKGREVRSNGEMSVMNPNLNTDGDCKVGIYSSSGLE